MLIHADCAHPSLMPWSCATPQPSSLNSRSRKKNWPNLSLFYFNDWLLPYFLSHTITTTAARLLSFSANKRCAALPHRGTVWLATKTTEKKKSRFVWFRRERKKSAACLTLISPYWLNFPGKYTQTHTFASNQSEIEFIGRFYFAM